MEKLLEKFHAVARTIAQERGPCKLFALLEKERVPYQWDVVLCSESLPDEDMEVLRYVVNTIQAVLSRREMSQLSAVILLDVNDIFIKALQQFLEEQNNPTAFSQVDINGLEVRKGYMIISPVKTVEKIQRASALLTKALTWVKKAAQQGDTEAQKTLGLMYAKGEGVKQNLTQAKRWLRKAAKQGDVQAQDHLRTCSKSV